MKLCTTLLLSAYFVRAVPNQLPGRDRRQAFAFDNDNSVIFSDKSAGSILSWDELQHLDGWEPDCALRATGNNHVPGVCTQYYECLNGQPTGAFNIIVRNCGHGTYWHSELNTCAFKWQANCDAAFRQPVTTTSTTTTTEEPIIVNKIGDMAAVMLDAIDGISASAFMDYGCAGGRNFDAFSKTMGRPVDDVDRAFYAWKKCVQCASYHDKTSVGAYDFNVIEDTCGSTNRAICECDRILIRKLVDSAQSLSEPIATPKCTYEGNGAHVDGLACCNWNTHHWAAYNSKVNCCGMDGVKEIGLC